MLNAGKGKNTVSQAVLPGSQALFRTHNSRAVISLLDVAFSPALLLKAFPFVHFSLSYLLACARRLVFLFSLLCDLVYHNHTCEVNKETLSWEDLANWTTRLFSFFTASHGIMAQRFDMLGNSIDSLKPR